MDNLCCNKKRLKILAFLFLATPFLAFAQAQEWIGETESLSELAVKIYKAIVQIAGICALLMIVWGGVEYAFFSTAEPEKVEIAKERIKYAIYGLLIVLLSWLLLYIISPEFVGSSQG